MISSFHRKLQHTENKKVRYGVCQRNPGTAAAIWQMLVNLGHQNCHGKAVLSQLSREYFLMYHFVVVPSQH